MYTSQNGQSNPSAPWCKKSIKHLCTCARYISRINPPNPTKSTRISDQTHAKLNILATSLRTNPQDQIQMFSSKSGNKSGLERSYQVPLHCRAVSSSQHLHHLVAPLRLNRLSGFPQSQIYSAVALCNSIYPSVCFAASQPPALLHGNAGREDITYSFLWKTGRLLPNRSRSNLFTETVVEPTVSTGY